MKSLMRSLSNVIAACALLALGPADAWSETACNLALSLADLPGPTGVIDHKTDLSDSDCTTQVIAKVDKSDPAVTKVDFKIDQSCASTGQAEITIIALVMAGDPPTTSCNVDYDNPEDQTEVGETTNIGDVPQLQDLLLAAANATAMQFPSGNPIADQLVAELTSVASPGCPCWPDGLDLFFTGATSFACFTNSLEEGVTGDSLFVNASSLADPPCTGGLCRCETNVGRIFGLSLEQENICKADVEAFIAANIGTPVGAPPEVPGGVCEEQ